MNDSVISARAAEACRTVFANADCAMRSSATSYGVGSSAGVPLSVKRARNGTSGLGSQSRSSAAASEPCSRSGGDSARTNRRASARLSCAARRARSMCPAAGEPSGRARSAARSSSWIEERPCARVSWISRARRSRSASVPACRSAAASSARVSISSSTIRRRRSLSRYSAW